MVSPFSLSLREAYHVTEEWKQARRREICQAQAIVLIASTNTSSVLSVKEKLQIAEMYARPVYVFWIAGERRKQAVPANLSVTLLIDAREARYETAVDELVTALSHLLPASHENHASSSGPEPPFEPRNPYKGLRAFRSADTRDFFGRDQLVDELVDTLERVLEQDTQGSETARPLAVVGPSGSGKSSVVMAGLVPRLQTGELPGSEDWVYLQPMVPGAHPLEALTFVLEESLKDRSHKAIREDLTEEGARGLHLFARHLAGEANKGVVLVVDQLEEVFTQTLDEHERKQFIDLLVTASTEPNGPLLVLLTLRADFYDRPMYYAEFGKIIGTQSKSVLPMSLKDLQAVIEQPAMLPDVQPTFEEQLVGDLLFETQEQIGALPLLQFTLDQLFQGYSGHTLTRQGYQEIGGVRGAVAKQAEETYAALLSEEHRRLARVLFLRLIEPGTPEQDTTRRRAPRAELFLSHPKETVILGEVVTAFTSARLLTTNTIAAVPTVEVSHEALIREWTRLVVWLRAAREDVYLQQIIGKDVTEWERHGKPKERLYRGSQLKDAKAWARRNTPNEREAAFLQVSTIRQTRSRLSVVTICFLVVLLLVAAGLQIQQLLLQNSTTVTTHQMTFPKMFSDYALDWQPFLVDVRSQTNLIGHDDREIHPWMDYTGYMVDPGSSPGRRGPTTSHIKSYPSGATKVRCPICRFILSILSNSQNEGSACVRIIPKGNAIALLDRN